MLIVSIAHAQSDRAGTWEFGGSALSLSSSYIAGSNGSSLAVDRSTGYGIFGAYHFTNRLALGFDANFADPKYRATLIPDGPEPPEIVNARLGVNIFHIKGTFNLLDRDVTPFVEIGAGWTQVDSNIISGIGGPICWWDPFWGYVCDNYYDTYTKTRSSRAYALGIRWDIDGEWVFRASWGLTEVDGDNSSADVEVDTAQLSFGWRF